jgi:hypothetical protein
VHLHEIWFDEKSSFAASAPANDKHVFVPGVGGVRGAVVHGEPFGLRQ